MSVKISPTATVCKEAELLGFVSVGPKTIIHPKCVIHAKNGPIVIGTENVFEERVVIVNERPEPMVIGNGNLFEVDARVVSTTVGDGNCVEPKASIRDSTVTNGCVVGATVELDAGTVVEENVAIVATSNGKLIKHEKSDFAQEIHISIMKHYVDIMGDRDSRRFLGLFHTLQT